MEEEKNPESRKPSDSPIAVDEASPSSEDDSSSEQVSTTIVASQHTFVGPLPHPEILHGYEQVLTGAAERIIQLTENQAAHRQNLERKSLRLNAIQSILGQVFSFILAFLTIGAGAYIIYSGRNIPGLMMVIAAVASLVGTFLYGMSKSTD